MSSGVSLLPPRQRRILAVAGTGRSGTSLFTGLSGRLGLYIPKPEVSANRSNPRGFGEPRWLVDYHNELLNSVAVMIEDGRPEAWDLTGEVATRPRARARLAAWLEEQFAEGERVIVKDPRLAWFIDLHRTVAADIGADLQVVTMLRDPAEVMKSREVAYGTKTNNTTRMAGWLNMMLDIEHRTRDLERASVKYVDLLDDWQAAFGVADESLHLGLLSAATPEQIDEADELVDPNLKRSVGDWDALELPPRLRDLAERSWATMQRLVGVPADEQGPVRADLDAVRAEFHDYFAECADVSRSRVGGARAVERRKTENRVRRQLAREAEERAAAAPRWRRVAGGVRRRARAQVASLRQRGGA